MEKKVRKHKKINNQKGFTLLEILVVLTIMGFLIAMVAPRLAGISSSAVDTVCDSNQNRTITMVAAYFERAGKFPNKLTNIVVQDGADADATATYYIPSGSNGDPDDGQETLAEEFSNRVVPKIHILSSNEVQELADMGIKKVFNLNSYDNFTTDGTNHGPDGTAFVATEGSPMQEATLVVGMGVMMSGIGIESTTTTDDFGTAVDVTGYGEADFLGRIIFGFGPENSLITSGLITNAAHCPGGLQNSDNITYNDYNLVVPRLASTVDRNDTTTPGIADRASSISDAQYVAYGYTEDFDTTPGTAVIVSTVDAAAGTHTTITAGTKARTLNFTAQELYQYSTMCPEGHMYPADDSDFWAVDIDGTAGIAF